MYTPRWSYASDPGFKYGFRLFGNGTTRALLGTPADPYYPCLARTHTHARIHARTHTCARTHQPQKRTCAGLILPGFSVTPTSAACNTHAFGGQATPALLPRTAVAQPAAHAASICAPGQDLAGYLPVTTNNSVRVDGYQLVQVRPKCHGVAEPAARRPTHGQHTPSTPSVGPSLPHHAVRTMLYRRGLLGRCLGRDRSGPRGREPARSQRAHGLLANKHRCRQRKERAGEGVGVVTVPVLDVAGL